MLQQTVLQRYAPDAVRQRLLALGGEALDAGEELPQTLRLLVRRLKRGRLNADINVSNLGQLSKALERAAVTLAIAIVTAAFALGLAPYLMHLSLRLWGIPLFLLLGRGLPGRRGALGAAAAALTLSALSDRSRPLLRALSFSTSPPAVFTRRRNVS